MRTPQLRAKGKVIELSDLHRMRSLAGVMALALVVASCAGTEGGETTAQGGATDTTQGSDDTTAPTEPGGDTETTPPSDGGADTTQAAGDGAESGTCAVDGAPQETSVLLPFPFAVPFFSIFAADALGYFEEEGLDVTISTADGSASVVQQVVADNVTFGISDPGPMIDAVALGEELKVVYVFQTGLIYGFVTPEGSPYEEITDLEGQVIGVSEATAGEVPFVEGLLASEGLEPGTDVEIVETGAGASTAAAFDSDRIVAYFSDFFNIIELGFEMPLAEFDLGEFGMLHAASVVTQSSTIDENPDLIVCLTRAMARASEFTHASPEAALIAIAEAYPDQVTDPEGFDLLAIEETIERTIPYEEGGGQWGWSRPASWEGYIDLLSSRGELTADLDPASLYTNDLIDETNDFDREAERQAAEELAASG